MTIMLVHILPLLGTACIAAALPVLRLAERQSTPWCSGLGPGAFDTAHNFTLTALNTTLPNSNSTGAPLVLGQAGAVPGEEYEVLSTYASYPYNDWPNLSLLAGALIPNTGMSASTTDTNVTAGSVLSFVTTGGDLPAPAQIYCAVADIDPTKGSPYPLLALNGDTDGFGLCMNGDGPYAQNNLVWQPTADNGYEYLYDTCYSVKLQLLGLN